MLIAALHWLRDGRSVATDEKLGYLATALEARLDEADRAALADLARRTGAVEPLRPLLDRLGLQVRADRARHDPVADPHRVDGREERGMAGGAAQHSASAACRRDCGAPSC